MTFRTGSTLPVLCAGLHSSGSTWLFNVVAALYEADPGDDAPPQAAGRRSVAQFYADSLEAFPPFAALPDVIVVKTHHPDKSLVILASICASPVLITLREPRDAIASLIVRFKFRFETALDAVAAAARHMVNLSRMVNPITLRFEDRFFADATTPHRVASLLGLHVLPSQIERITESLQPANVKRTIEDLARQGAFGRAGGPGANFDLKTHWHPDHVGDLEIGKFARVLSAEQQARIIMSTQEYCEAFGYESDLPRASGLLAGCDRARYAVGDTIRFCSGSDAAGFLTGGWSDLEGDLVRGVGERSEITLWMMKLPPEPEDFRLRLEVQPCVWGIAPQRLSVVLNGELLCDAQLSARATLDLGVPRELIERKVPTTITLIHPDTARPCDHVPGSTDDRELSVALRWLQLAAAVAEAASSPLEQALGETIS